MTSSEINLRVTGQSSQGGRKYMEDTFVVAYQQTEDKKDLEYAFFGIFDGHGGKEAAHYAKNNLLDNIVCLKHFWQDEDEMILSAIRDGFLNTHMAMWKEVDSWPKTASGLPSTAGTTASVAFLRKGKLYTGHVGDSRIVIGLQEPDTEEWQAESLTVDHKPESPREKQRILESGGLVMNKSGVDRVVWKRPKPGHEGPILRSTDFEKIPFLAVARSLGDLWSYDYFQQEFAVSPEPDLGVMPLDLNKDKCLILASDGLWNIMSPQDAVHLVQDVEKENGKLISKFGVSENIHLTLCNPSRVLVDCSLEKWNHLRTRADNVSVLTILLDETDAPHPCSTHPALKMNHPRSLPVWDVGLKCRGTECASPSLDMTEREARFLQKTLQASNPGSCEPYCNHNAADHLSPDSETDEDNQIASGCCCELSAQNSSHEIDEGNDFPHGECSHGSSHFHPDIAPSNSSPRDEDSLYQFPRWSKNATGRTSLSKLATWSRVVSYRRLSDPFPRHCDDDAPQCDSCSLSDDEDGKRTEGGQVASEKMEEESVNVYFGDGSHKSKSSGRTGSGYVPFKGSFGTSQSESTSTSEDVGINPSFAHSAPKDGDDQITSVKLAFDRDLCDQGKSEPSVYFSDVLQNYKNSNSVLCSDPVTLEGIGFERDSLSQTPDSASTLNVMKSSFVEDNFKVCLDQLCNIKQAIKRKYPGAEISQSFISSCQVNNCDDDKSQKRRLDLNFSPQNSKSIVTEVNS